MKHSGVDWLGDVPSHWKLLRARFMFKQSTTKGNERLVLLSATQDRGVVDKSTLDSVVQVAENADLSLFKTVHKNDFVISLRSFQGGFEISHEEGVISPAYTVFRLCNQDYPHYYRYLFKSYGFIDKINSLTVGIREGKNIQYVDFSNMFLPCLDIDEQQKIASFLDEKCSEIDEMVVLQEKIIEELKAYKQSVITEAVTKGLNPDVPMKDSGIEWIGEIPKSYNCSKLKYYIKIDSGDAISNELISREGKYPVYGGGEIMGYHTVCNTSKDCLIIGRVGARCGCVTMPNIECWATDNALVLKTSLDLKYMYYLLTGLNLNRLNISNAQPLITATKVKNEHVPLPPLSEQQSIASYLDEKCTEIDNLISIKQSKIESLKEYKKSIIYEYVTGKKEVI